MFTLTQYLIDQPLIWGVIADVLFFGSLYFGRQEKG